MSDKHLTTSPVGEFMMFASDDGRVRVECRFGSDTSWLSQAAIANLYDKDVRTINEHLINIFSEGELDQNPTIRKFRIVRQYVEFKKSSAFLKKRKEKRISPAY